MLFSCSSQKSLEEVFQQSSSFRSCLVISKWCDETSISSSTCFFHGLQNMARFQNTPPLITDGSISRDHDPPHFLLLSRKISAHFSAISRSFSSQISVKKRVFPHLIQKFDIIFFVRDSPRESFGSIPLIIIFFFFKKFIHDANNQFQISKWNIQTENVHAFT